MSDTTGRVDTENSKEFVYWRDAVCNELPFQDTERFLAALRNIRPAGNIAFFSRMTLWQLEDPTYGLRHIRAVRRDRQLAGFCSALADLFLKESANGVILREELEDVFKTVEPIWSEVGLKKKLWTGFIRYRFAWVGGRTLIQLWTRGWWETWAWVSAAARKRGRGQVSVLVWSWARAGGGKKSSAVYNDRMRALRNHFLGLLNI